MLCAKASVASSKLLPEPAAPHPDGDRRAGEAGVGEGLERYAVLRAAGAPRDPDAGVVGDLLVEWLVVGGGGEDRHRHHVPRPRAQPRPRHPAHRAGQVPANLVAVRASTKHPTGRRASQIPAPTTLAPAHTSRPG